MRAAAHFLLAILLAHATCGRLQGSPRPINARGVPLITNFTPEQYEAADQNWAAVQDHRGVMYFGNTDGGVLEFDGRTWRRIPVPHDFTVRSLAVHPSGVVYVGLVGDFGYLRPDPAGQLRFQSLAGHIASTIGPFTDVLRTFVIQGKVYFYTRNYIFVWDGQTLTTLDIGPIEEFYNFLSFVANGRLYVGSWARGLREVANQRIAPAPGYMQFAESNIFSILPHTDSLVLVITQSGIFRFHQRTGQAVNMIGGDYNLLGILADGIPYHSIRTAYGHIAMGLLYSDRHNLMILDTLGHIREVLNRANGLQNEQPIYLYQSSAPIGSNPLWVCLNRGISYAEINSPIRRFGEESGFKGAIMDIIRFEHTLLIATSSGLFALQFDRQGFPYFRQLPINSATWRLLPFRDPHTQAKRLLVGTLDGIFEVTPRLQVNSISHRPEFRAHIQHECYSLLQSRVDPSVVYIGMGAGLAAMRWANGRWQNLGPVLDSRGERIMGEIRTISEDPQGTLWLGTFLQGVVRVADPLGRPEVTYFDTSHGLHSMKDNMGVSFDDQILFATPNGIVRFNPATSRFEPSDLPRTHVNLAGSAVGIIAQHQEGYVYSYVRDGHRWVELIIPRGNRVDTIVAPFKRLPTKGVDAFHTDADGTLWVAMSNELFSLDPLAPKDYGRPFHALIRRVAATGDSVLFHGSFFTHSDQKGLQITLEQPSQMIPSLAYRYNSLTFEFSAPFYQRDDLTEFSVQLEGFDDRWSSWTREPKAVYTNLHEGSYTFRVKARNIYGVISSVASYSFTIAPPWYRSIVAFLIYFLLLVGLIWLIVKLNTKRLIAEKVRLEGIVQERTAEVQAQKFEIEKQLVEIERQRDTIFEQNEEIRSSITYASRIQSALLTPAESIQAVFRDHFILYLPRDIVSGDFYWVTQIGPRKICVVADCTGHGVPGGFMSMLGIGFLSQILAKGEQLSAAEILNRLRELIIGSLHQTGKSGESKDGMDLALYILDTTTHTLEFAGANNPLILVRDNGIMMFKADKMPIGIHVKHAPFTNHVTPYRPGDVLYTFSDGYVDQFGGPHGRKFMVKHLKELLLAIHPKPMEEQRRILLDTFEQWRADFPPIDDVVVMGVRL